MNAHTQILAIIEEFQKKFGTTNLTVHKVLESLEARIRKIETCSDIIDQRLVNVLLHAPQVGHSPDFLESYNHWLARRQQALKAVRDARRGLIDFSANAMTPTELIDDMIAAGTLEEFGAQEDEHGSQWHIKLTVNADTRDEPKSYVGGMDYSEDYLRRKWISELQVGDEVWLFDSRKTYPESHNLARVVNKNEIGNVRIDQMGMWFNNDGVSILSPHIYRIEEVMHQAEPVPHTPFFSMHDSVVVSVEVPKVEKALAEVTECLKQILAVLRREAPGTALNGNKYTDLGIRCYEAVAQAEKVLK